MSKIRYSFNDVNLFDKSHWPKMNDFFMEYLPKFENAFQSQIDNLKS